MTALWPRRNTRGPPYEQPRVGDVCRTVCVLAPRDDRRAYASKSVRCVRPVVITTTRTPRTFSGEIEDYKTSVALTNRPLPPQQTFPSADEGHSRRGEANSPGHAVNAPFDNKLFLFSRVDPLGADPYGLSPWILKLLQKTLVDV